MENLFNNIPVILLFVFSCILLKIEKRDKKMDMLYIKVKNFLVVTLLIFMVSSVLFATDSYALFDDLTSKGAEIFTGMRDIIYVVAGFGIIGVAVGGFFGTLNWKWLGAIIIGLTVIALTGSFITAVAGPEATVKGITDTLK